MNLFDEFKLAFEFQSEHHYTVIKLKLKIILKRNFKRSHLIILLFAFMLSIIKNSIFFPQEKLPNVLVFYDCKIPKLVKIQSKPKFTNQYIIKSY